jgi:peroxiredoxin
MRPAAIALLLVSLAVPILAQDSSDQPTSEKAQKSYKVALQDLRDRMTGPALDEFKKADKQDGGHCVACQKKMIKYGTELRDWKTAEQGAEEMIGEMQDPKKLAVAHYEFGMVLMHEGLDKKKDEFFAREHDELVKALAAYPKFPEAILADGRALARMKQDDAAKAQFKRYVELASPDDPERQRALRYIDDPELARARMAPAFAITTMDGQRLTLDDLKGKVVLLDFWATWCMPCREALPHVRDIAKKFQGQPLVIMSVSLDDSEEKWKDFVAKNGMTWINYRDDGGFRGPIAKMFGVEAIPHTFTIDADGVLQDEHIGDAAIEGKLKKLLARARELQTAEKPAS